MRMTNPSTRRDQVIAAGDAAYDNVRFGRRPPPAPDAISIAAATTALRAAKERLEALELRLDQEHD